MYELVPLGGASEIGASSFYLNVEGTGVLLDCGMHPRKRGSDALPALDLITRRDVDFCLISHAHTDHLGSLPFLVQRYLHVRVYSTPQTRAIAELTLHDTVSILQEQLGTDDPLRPYRHEEIDLLIQSIGWHAYGERFSLRGLRHRNEHPLFASLFDAGHILGSAGILLECGDRRIAYTGDIDLDHQSLLPGAALPSAAVDTLILECTHGATESSLLPPWKEEVKRFARRVNAVIEQGGSVLVPVFAVGKLQEMLALIWRLMEKGTLAPVDIYTGGIGRKINRVYDRNRFVVPMIDPEFELSTIPQLDLYTENGREEYLRKPSIVLASSGMMIEQTPSFNLTKRWLDEKRNSIFIVGYMDPDTPGYRVATAERGSTIQFTDYSRPQKVRCSVDRFRFTAHSRRDGLLEIVKRLRPGRVILVHGDTAAIDWMGRAILDQHPRMKVHAAEVGRSIELSG